MHTVFTYDNFKEMQIGAHLGQMKKSLSKIKFEKQLLLMNDVPSFLLTMNF